MDTNTGLVAVRKVSQHKCPHNNVDGHKHWLGGCYEKKLLQGGEGGAGDIPPKTQISPPILSHPKLVLSNTL